MHTIVYNGQSSASLSLTIDCENPYPVPIRRHSEYLVPGRNGTVLVDDGCYDNVQIPYQIASYGNDLSAVAITTAIKSWLMPHGGYQRLEDSRDPDCYRLARVTEAQFEPVGYTGKKVKGSVTFDCLPERWLKSGEEPRELRKSTTATPYTNHIYNELKYTAYPLLYVGSSASQIAIGAVHNGWFGYVEIHVEAHDGTILIDTQTRNAVYLDGQLGGTSANNVVSWHNNTSNDFCLEQGDTQISVSAASPADADVPVQMKARWWQL